VHVDGLAAGGGDGEGEGLPGERGVALPVGAPVAVQPDPPRLGPLHRHRPQRPAPGHVGDHDQLEVVEPADLEPEPALPPALHSARTHFCLLEFIEEDASVLIILTPQIEFFLLATYCWKRTGTMPAL
jgi:hypothetical protein